MAKIPAKNAFMQQLLADNVEYIFGNPGTVEEGFLDVLADYPQIKYIMGLQESVVTAMADGYARASKKTPIVQLHSAVGLGNAIAMLYQAHRSFTPMVMFVGETYSNLEAYDGFLGGSTVDIAKPVTKWAYRVTHSDQLLRVLRRAIKVASTPPQGPIFLSIPMDVFDGMVDESEIVPTSFVNDRVIPEPKALRDIARGLVNAQNPLMLIGDGVSISDANKEVKELSELLGCPVYGVDFANLSASFKDPLFMGLIGHSFGDRTREITLQADTILSVGTPLFPELFPVNKPYFQKGAKLYQIDLNKWEIAKNYPVDEGLLADPKMALKEIINNVKPHITTDIIDKIHERKKKWVLKKEQAWKEQEEAYERQKNNSPMAPSAMMKEVVEMLPENTLVYDESITSTDELLHYLRPSNPELYYLGRGGCIGVGWPGAIGAKLANPDKPVFAPSGDGSCLYVIQSLWTAAKYNLHIIFMVCNNKSYRILKVNLLNYWEQNNDKIHKFPWMMNINSPTIRFSDIAKGLGVSGYKAETTEELKIALKKAFNTPGPHLIDVTIDGKVTDEIKSLIHCYSGCA